MRWDLFRKELLLPGLGNGFTRQTGNTGCGAGVRKIGVIDVCVCVFFVAAAVVVVVAMFVCVVQCSFECAISGS